MNKKIKFIIIVVVCIAIILGVYLISKSNISLSPSGLDNFAKCITQSGAKMYGAYWCPHCKDQKALFGTSLQYINYVECDANGPNAQPEECQKAGITGYPTWIINEKQYSGLQTLNKLASLTNCKL